MKSKKLNLSKITKEETRLIDGGLRIDPAPMPILVPIIRAVVNFFR